MTCPFCGKLAHFESVDVGVGYAMQVAPAECTSCGAAQDGKGGWHTAEELEAAWEAYCKANPPETGP